MMPRKNPPTGRTNWGDAMPFKVWANVPIIQEDTYPWKCVALFRYWQEALDYIRAVNLRGISVYVRSPGADCLEYAPDRWC